MMCGEPTAQLNAEIPYSNNKKYKKDKNKTLMPSEISQIHFNTKLLKLKETALTCQGYQEAKQRVPSQLDRYVHFPQYPLDQLQVRD